LIERFHNIPWEERLELVAALKDRRLRKIGQRLIYLERPDLLPDLDRSKYDRAIALRIGRDEAEVPWLTLPRALADLDELLEEADPLEVPFLQEHRTHLASRLRMATLALGAPATVAVENHAGGTGVKARWSSRSMTGRSGSRTPRRFGRP
jgi:exodeoxyribonuclease-1